MVSKNYSDMPVNQNVKGIHMGAGVPNISDFFLVGEEKDSFMGSLSTIV